MSPLNNACSPTAPEAGGNAFPPAIIESTPFGMFVCDAAGAIRFVNPVACDIIGRTSVELAGRGWLDAFHPLDRARLQNSWENFLARPGNWEAELQFARADGSNVVTHVRVSPIREEDRVTGYVGAVQDISERKRSEETLRASEQRYRTVLDSLAEGVLVVDGEGTIIATNESAPEILGLQREVLLGRSLIAADWQMSRPDGSLFPPPGNPVAVTVRTGRPCSDVVMGVPRPDGSRVWLSVNTRPVCGTGESTPYATVASFADITSRLQAEGALRNSLQERRRFEGKLQETQRLESLGVLAGGIAHDFNNLLAAILGNADLARMSLPAGVPAIAYLDNAEKAAFRAADLCKQMLAYAGKGCFEIRKLDLGAFVRESTELLHLSISKKAVLQLDLPPSLPPVEADTAQLRQVVMNLVMNASEAIGDSPGVIRVRTGLVQMDGASQPRAQIIPDESGTAASLPPATFGAEDAAAPSAPTARCRETIREPQSVESLAEGYYVFLEVNDNGCGMTRESREKIFEPFFTTKLAGRGLGLAAVQGIVRSHRGALQVESRPGKGSTFRIFLPAAGGVVEECRTHTAASPAWQGAGRVLVVDDEDSVRFVAAHMLKELGFETAPAVDGHEAIEKIRIAPDTYDVLLLDLTMPNFDGEQTLREVRRLCPNLPVVLMSGYSEQEATMRFGDTGPAGFLQKPFTHDELRAQLQGVLN